MLIQAAALLHRVASSMSMHGVCQLDDDSKAIYRKKAEIESIFVFSELQQSM